MSLTPAAGSLAPAVEQADPVRAAEGDLPQVREEVQRGHLHRWVHSGIKEVRER